MTPPLPSAEERARLDTAHRAHITRIALSFPTIKNRKPPGIEPFDASQLLEWLKHHEGTPGHGERLAYRFVLYVWNGHGDDGGDFDFRDAWSTWDYRHREAFVRWCAAEAHFELVDDARSGSP